MFSVTAWRIPLDSVLSFGFHGLLVVCSLSDVVMRDLAGRKGQREPSLAYPPNLKISLRAAVDALTRHFSMTSLRESVVKNFP